MSQMNIYFPGNTTIQIEILTFEEWNKLENKPDGAFVISERYIIIELYTKLTEVHDLVQEWKTKIGHDQCHYYPDILQKIADVLGICIDPKDLKLPPRDEFRKMCGKYEEELYDE